MAGPWEKYGAQTKPANVMLPGQIRGQQLDLTGKGLSNTKTALEIRNEEATSDAQRRSANARAVSDEISARQAQEQWNLAHPKTDPRTSGLYGNDFLKTLSQGDQNFIKALSEYRLAIPERYISNYTQGKGVGDPFWKTKIDQLLQYDPSFDMQGYKQKLAARMSAVNGKLGTSNNALDTAIGHAGLLMQQSDGPAGHGGLGVLSYGANALENFLNKGAPELNNYNDTAQKLASEETTAYRNGGGAEADVMRYLSTLNPNLPLKSKQEAIRNAMDLFASKIAANLNQYDWGTQGSKPPLTALNPHTVEVLKTYAPEVLNKYFAAGGAVGPNGGNGPNGGPPQLDPGPNNPGVAPVTPGSQYHDVADPKVSAAIDSAVRQNVPYGVFVRQMKGDYPDYNPPAPSEYNAARRYAKAHPDYQGSYGSATRAVPLTLGEKITNDIGQSGVGAFAGHAINAAGAGIPQMLAGDRGAYFNAVSDQQHPTLSTLGDVGGTIAGSIGAGKALGATAPFLGKVGQFMTANPIRAGLASDMTFGGVSGAANNPDNPIAGGILGAGAMGAGNLAGRYVLGPALAAAGDSKAGQAIANMVLKRGGGSFSPPAALDPGQSIVVNTGKKTLGDITNKMQQASELNLPYALADADPRLRVLAGSAVRKSPDVRTLAESVLPPRQSGQAERAIQQINTNLAPVGDVPAIKADAVSRAQAASQPLYEKAMQAPPPNDPALNEMLDTPAGQQAIRNAYNIALNAGEKPGNLSFSVDPQGNPIIKGTPNWKTLQYAKMGLDSVIENSRDAVTGKLNMADPTTRAVNDLRARFVGRLGELNPDYAAANSAYQGLIGQGTAAERGAAATAPRVTPEQAQIAVTNAGDNLPYFQRGYASNMADQVERQRLSGNPYDLVNGSLGQQAKLGTVFPQGAPDFMRAQALEGDMSKTAYEALGGSPTASRMEADKLFNNPVADAGFDAAGALLTGAPPLKTMARVAMKLGDLQRLGIRGAKEKADQIGPILLNTDPQANMATLADLVRMQAARQQYVNQAGTLGGLLGAPTVFALTNR